MQSAIRSTAVNATLRLNTQSAMHAGSEGSRGAPRGSEVFRGVPRGSEGFRGVPKGSEGFRAVPR
eukprot:8097233-Alexandrium_andersonii.AAC.1